MIPTIASGFTRPTEPERAGLRIVDAPGVPAGWRRVCVFCGCSVSAAHVPNDDICQMLAVEGREGRRG